MGQCRIMHLSNWGEVVLGISLLELVIQVLFYFLISKTLDNKSSIINSLLIVIAYSFLFNEVSHLCI